MHACAVDAEAWTRIESSFPFTLDAFQRRSVERLLAGRNVVVCAPTGAGKTAIAEVRLCVWQWCRCGGECVLMVGLGVNVGLWYWCGWVELLLAGAGKTAIAEVCIKSYTLFTADILKLWDMPGSMKPTAPAALIAVRALHDRRLANSTLQCAGPPIVFHPD